MPRPILAVDPLVATNSYKNAIEVAIRRALARIKGSGNDEAILGELRILATDVSNEYRILLTNVGQLKG